MSRLLYADFVKLRKSRFFWISVIVMALWGIFMKVMEYIATVSYGYEPPALSSMLFAFALFAGILQAAQTSIFFGTEYSDGTIRNKLIIGHTRAAIYLSNLTVCSVAGIAMCTAYLAGALAAGIPLCGLDGVSLKGIVILILCTFLMSLALTSLFTLIVMLCQNKALSAVATLLGVCFFIVVSIYVTAKLSQPETIPQVTYTLGDAGQAVAVSDESTPDIPNPAYPRGMERRVYQFLESFLPTGVGASLSQGTLASPGLSCLYQGIITVAATGIGISAFRKRDIK